MTIEPIPGWEGSIGPFPHQYADPHVYARDVHSGAGNCVCGAAFRDRLHVQAAPGVPMPGTAGTAEPVAQATHVCGDLHTRPGMKGFYRCGLDPGHVPDHQSQIGATVVRWPRAVTPPG